MHEVKSIQDLLNQISRDEILLPEFERGYVWNRDQVRGLMQSLYRKHPTGHLLIWRTYKPSLVRGGEAARDGHSLLLLDGQQRLTTLYVLFKGRTVSVRRGPATLHPLDLPGRPVGALFGFHGHEAPAGRGPGVWPRLAGAMNEFIAGWLPEKEADPEQHVRELIAAGESDTLEFKSSLRWDRREDKVNKVLEGVVVKTVAGFLNATGGTLLIGIDDAGALVGLAADYGTFKKQDRDGFELHLQNLFARDLGEAASAAFLNVNFHEIDGQDICHVTVEPSDYPIYVEHQQEAIFHLRVGNGTRALPVKEAVQYVGQRWGKTA